MAMLAEPRQKKRYHLTPRGKPLFEDADRFGTKMLEKMGWSKGKGLGKTEEGTLDFIRVKYKSDEKGLGYEDRDDQWTEHDKNFNGLLQNLNGNSTECPDVDCEMIEPTVGLGFATKTPKAKKLKDKISGQSLEENSKKSKARVHYKKFTKGKDTSQYSEKDLANIFGKKATPDETNIYSQFQAFNAPGSDNDVKEDDKNDSTDEEKEKTLPPIINTGISVNDYFKAKMDALKQKQGLSTSNPFQSNVRIINNVEVVIPTAKRKRSTDDNKSLEEEKEKSADEVIAEDLPPKKKKSKKHSIECEDDDVSKENQAEENVSRKKKKSKKQTLESEETEKVDLTEEHATIEEEHVPRKKKKCKKQPIENEDTKVEQNLEAANGEESQKEKKKKKKNAQPDANKEQDEPTIIVLEDNETKETPKKKKKQTSTESAANPEIPSLPQVCDNTSHNNTESISEASNSSKRSKKSKKHKDEILEINDEENEIPKKKKKKDKKKSIIDLCPSEEETENIEPINPNPKVGLEINSKSHKKNKKSEEVSSNQTDLNPLKNTNNFLYDTFTISKFCAEQFRNLEFQKFIGSNLMDINGYGMSTDLKLDIETRPIDAERITRLWIGTLDKYTHASSTNKVYFNYKQKIKLARRSHKKPTLKTKTLKRKSIFQCI